MVVGNWVVLGGTQWEELTVVSRIKGHLGPNNVGYVGLVRPASPWVIFLRAGSLGRVAGLH